MGHSGRTIRLDVLRPALQQNYGKTTVLSYWAVPKDGKDHIEAEGSLSGWTGPVWMPALVLDIDARDLGDALLLSREVVHMLERGYDVPRSAIQPWFSGGKGYHLHIHPGVITSEMGRYVPAFVHDVCTDVFGTWTTAKGDDEAHVDLSMISHQWPTGLIRAPWSHHSKTGGFKIPILVDELMNDPYGRHRGWSQAPKKHRSGVNHPEVDATVRPTLAESTEYKLDEYPLESTGSPVTTSSEAPDKPSKRAKPDYITCMFHLWNRGPVDGRRHNDLERLAASFAQRGLGRQQIESLLKKWLHAPEKGLPMDRAGEADCEDLARRASGEGDEARWTRFRCDDEIMTEFCDSHCRLYKYREVERPLLRTEDLMNRLDDYLSVTDDEGVWLDNLFPGVKMQFHPGDLVLLLGDTKLGKTALFQNLALTLTGHTVLDLSTEMHPALHAKRYLQIAHSLRVNEQKNIDEVKEARRQGKLDTYKSVLDHIHVVTTTPELNDLEPMIRDSQADVVLIDPLEKIRVEGRSDLGAMVAVMRQCKDIARRTGIIFLIVNHINKSGQREGGLPDIYDSKGYKTVTEEANFVFAFGGDPDSKLRRLKLQRCTHHMELDIILRGDPETFQFWTTDQQVENANISTRNLPA